MKSKLIGLGFVVVLLIIALILFLGFHEEKLDHSETTKKIEVSPTK
jgi:hypothetical protein